MKCKEQRRANQEHFAWQHLYDQPHMRRQQLADCEERIARALILSECFAQVPSNFRYLLPNPLPRFTEVEHPADKKF